MKFSQEYLSCVVCKKVMPLDWYWYSALNESTGEILKPLCALCIRRETTAIFDFGKWRFSEPHKQNSFGENVL